MKVKFLGAAGTVTGSGYVVETNTGTEILVDLGMFQGPPEIDELNYEPLKVDVSKLAGAVVTHAHLDHCGRTAMLPKMGFSGKLHLTAPTAELVELSLLDSAKIANEDHPERVLYTEEDVKTLVGMFEIVDYDKPFKIGDVEIVMRDAGHIIGSASVEMKVDGKTIVFSGDLGNTPEDLTEPTEMIKTADIAVVESTYGDKNHPEGEPEELLRAEINAVENSGGTLLIPAFSLERTQEILHIISHLKAAKQVEDETPVFLDSPMAQKATNIYDKYRNFLNDEIKKDFMNANPFDFPGLTVVRNRKESSSIDGREGAKVIIAGSGMMTGGRIIEHAKTYLEDENARILIVGYQGEGTLGREIISGEKNVKIGKEMYTVRAAVNEIQVMSSHADQKRLMNWLKAISGLKQVIITHGEGPQRTALAEKIKAELGGVEILMPEKDSEVEV